MIAYPLTYKQFYEGLKKGKLLGLKCRICEALTVPPKMCCAKCTSTDLELVELSGRGEIKTFTVIRVAPEEFTAPYVVVMVELDEGPWVLGNLEGVDPDQASMKLIGEKVTIGHKVILPVKYNPGEGVVMIFSLT
ncbi:MAG TPA: nucleic acid-binding protein [Desulfotomaculum sp.]|jgi:hypothetical protein|nr:nucleic acid-binding protein [Desulfotomaculum sp.]